MAKDHRPWSDFMVHGVNRSLDLTRQVTVRLGPAIIFPLLENESPVTQMQRINFLINEVGGS